MGKREPLEGNIFTHQSKKRISFLQIMIHYHLIDVMIKIASNLLDLVSIYVLKKKARVLLVYKREIFQIHGLTVYWKDPWQKKKKYWEKANFFENHMWI